MIIVLGANGHVGSSTAKTLLQKDKSALVVLHNAEKEKFWKHAGAEVTVADVNDPQALQQVFNNGKKAFILNPPAPPSTDTVAVEKKSAAAIVKALKNSSIVKLVAASTYGAQPGEGIGDLGVLYEMEQGLAALSIATTVIRSAYYMSNWDSALKSAQEDSIVHSLYPADFKLPMVSPGDIGHFAAQLLTELSMETTIEYMEGPEAYSANDVAAAFSVALGKPVTAKETTPEQWIPGLQQMGFSAIAAKSMAAMTDIILKKNYAVPEKPNRGKTSLQAYISGIAEKSISQKLII